jgi:hypothetical protein
MTLDAISPGALTGGGAAPNLVPDTLGPSAEDGPGEPEEDPPAPADAVDVGDAPWGPAPAPDDDVDDEPDGEVDGEPEGPTSPGTRGGTSPAWASTAAAARFV